VDTPWEDDWKPVELDPVEMTLCGIGWLQFTAGEAEALMVGADVVAEIRKTVTGVHQRFA
jgi:hypothetical protein